MYNMIELFGTDDKKAIVLDSESNIIANGILRFKKYYPNDLSNFYTIVNEFELYNFMDGITVIGTEFKADTLPSTWSIRFEHNGNWIKFEKVVFNGDLYFNMNDTGNSMKATFDIIEIWREEK